MLPEIYPICTRNFIKIGPAIAEEFESKHCCMRISSIRRNIRFSGMQTTPEGRLCLIYHSYIINDSSCISSCAKVIAISPVLRERNATSRAWRPLVTFESIRLMRFDISTHLFRATREREGEGRGGGCGSHFLVFYLFSRKC